MTSSCIQPTWRVVVYNPQDEQLYTTYNTVHSPKHVFKPMKQHTQGLLGASFLYTFMFAFQYPKETDKYEARYIYNFIILHVQARFTKTLVVLKTLATLTLTSIGTSFLAILCEGVEWALLLTPDSNLSSTIFNRFSDFSTRSTKGAYYFSAAPSAQDRKSQHPVEPESQRLFFSSEILFLDFRGGSPEDASESDSSPEYTSFLLAFAILRQLLIEWTCRSRSESDSTDVSSWRAPSTAASLSKNWAMIDRRTRRIAESKKKPRIAAPRNRRLCPHCNKMLLLKTYKWHENFFFRDGAWVVDESISGISDSDTEGLMLYSKILKMH